MGVSLLFMILQKSKQYTCLSECLPTLDITVQLAVYSEAQSDMKMRMALEGRVFKPMLPN